MPRPMLTAFAVTVALSAPAFALPTLEKAAAGGVSFLEPAGWSVRVEQGPVTAIHIEERAGAADSPSVMLMSMPLQQGPQTPALFAAQMVQTVMATPKQEAQQAAPGGGLQVWSGTIGGIPAKLAIVHQALPAQGMGLLGAFANLLHAMGCQADPTLVLVTSSARQSCAQTLQQWAQTVQFVGQAEAPRQAATERGQLRVAARCTSGQIDPASCGTYQRTLADMNAQSHDTMIRIIRNMNGTACTVGEAGCVPY